MRRVIHGRPRLNDIVILSVGRLFESRKLSDALFRVCRMLKKLFGRPRILFSSFFYYYFFFGRQKAIKASPLSVARSHNPPMDNWLVYGRFGPKTKTSIKQRWKP